MKEFLYKYFITDRRQTKILFANTFIDNDGETIYYDIFVDIETFIDMFEPAIKLAMDNGTDIMDEIRKFDPENTRGYNNLIY